MQKNGINALKRMAQMAKSRLRNKVVETENKYSKKGKFKMIFGEGVDYKCKIITKDDLKLYEKVKTILDENIDVVNPISKLIDYKTYNKMDAQTQERYLFDLVDKYKRYKEKYISEKQQIV